MKLYKKKNLKLNKAGKLTLCFLVLLSAIAVFQLYIAASNRAMKRELMETNFQITTVKEDISNIKGEIRAINDRLVLEKYATLSFMSLPENDINILVTNYWVGDGSSGLTTASGLTTKDFDVNSDGMYTYQDKVVLATANTTRLGKPLKEGYRSHELYDELELTFNGKGYDAIVLDVCGACFGTSNEDRQRYDVFTTSNILGKQEGILHE